MKRRKLPYVLLALGLLALSRPVGGEGLFKRAQWDQEKAVEKVEDIIELEETGEPWNDIAWEVDPARAAEKAKNLKKPVFVYLYLKKPVGPAADPG